MTENEVKKKCENLKQQLKKLYEKSIICKISKAEEYSCPTKGFVPMLAVCLHYGKQIAIVWDLRRRKEKGRDGKSVYLSKESYKNLKPISNRIYPEYKRMDNYNLAPFEKILIMHIDTLENIIFEEEDLRTLILFDPKDETYPEELKKQEPSKVCEEFDIMEERSKSTTSYYNRRAKFREEVLEKYQYQCAICRCSEEKILQAAHIRAVADKGSDAVENGICLCANHHLMFDKGLLKIKHKTLIDVAESVKKMPWYKVFKEEYNGIILEGK